MCHEIDPAQAAELQFREDAVAEARYQATRARGAARCVDCGEPIGPLRQQLGAIRCLDCERDVELQRRRGGSVH